VKEIKKLLKSNKLGEVTGYCSIAFTNILINENGEIFSCGCEDWVKKSLGNILSCNNQEDLDNLLSIDSEFKKSISDKNYRFCNAFKCHYLQRDIIENKVIFPFVSDIKNLNLKQLYLQIDESCNLECPSCRNRKILHKNNKKTEKVKVILSKINDLILEKHEELFIRLNGNGELFASHTILPWLLKFDFEKFNKVKFFFHSNGTLLYKYEEFLNNLVNNLSGFEISIDAASEKIYSIVRKGGNWNNLNKGLSIINNLRQKNKNINLKISFVVSETNYHEMEDFLKFSQKLDANVFFYKLQRYNINEKDFSLLNIFSPSHVKHNDFINILKKIKNYDFNCNFYYLFNDL